VTTTKVTSAVFCATIVMEILVWKMSKYASISVRGFEPKGNLCAKGSEFAMVDAWSLNPSVKAA
jgi:hypothetical protein